MKQLMQVLNSRKDFAAVSDKNRMKRRDKTFKPRSSKDWVKRKFYVQ